MPELLEDEEFEEEKDCWICFVRESENRQATWVTPCKCAGSMGHVHQDCIKRWVEEKQSGNINEEGTSCSFTNYLLPNISVMPAVQYKIRVCFPREKRLLTTFEYIERTNKMWRPTGHNRKFCRRGIHVLYILHAECTACDVQ